MENTHNWYYAVKGEQVGPITFEEMSDLAKSGTITPKTKVWPGEGDWQEAKDCFLLSGVFNKPPQDGPPAPPPLAGTDIDNRLVWGVVAVPVVGIILELIIGMNLIVLYIAANVLLCFFDEKKLKKAGHNAPVNWMIFVIPVYLWKRAELLGQKKNYFWGWIAAFFLSIFISILANESMIEESACPLVTQIIQSQMRTDVECKKVTIVSEVSEGFYIADAILSNGNELRITIEEKDDDMIYVQIPNQ